MHVFGCYVHKRITVIWFVIETLTLVPQFPSSAEYADMLISLC